MTPLEHVRNYTLQKASDSGERILRGLCTSHAEYLANVLARQALLEVADEISEITNRLNRGEDL